MPDYNFTFRSMKHENSGVDLFYSAIFLLSFLSELFHLKLLEHFTRKIFIEILWAVDNYTLA